MSTLGTILKDNWAWRKQIGRLALFELVKKSRGAVLSWSWFFIKPAMYIFCFWFALDIGLRVGSGAGASRCPAVYPVAVRRTDSVVLHAGHAGCGNRRHASLPIPGEQDQVPLSGISTIFHGRYHACAVDAYGGASSSSILLAACRLTCICCKCPCCC